MSDFKVGDVVMLKSGGPKMTVCEYKSDTVHVLWFNKSGALDECWFYPLTLQLVN